MVSDTVGDFLARIRNAHIKMKPYATMPSSRMLLAISKILKEEGFIEDFNEETNEQESYLKVLKIKLRYVNDKPAILNLERVSKPGVRVYIGYRDIEKIRGGQGITILSTPKGVLSGDKAIKERVGGELLCKVW